MSRVAITVENPRYIGSTTSFRFFSIVPPDDKVNPFERLRAMCLLYGQCSIPQRGRHLVDWPCLLFAMIASAQHLEMKNETAVHSIGT